MALFYYRKSKILKGSSSETVFEVSLEAGVIPMNLLGEKSLGNVMDLSAKAQERTFRAIHADYLRNLGSGLAHDLRTYVTSKARAMAEGRYLAFTCPPENEGQAEGDLAALMDEAGHKLIPLPEKTPPIHVMRDSEGQDYLAVEGAWALRASTQLTRLGASVDETVLLPGTHLHRVVLSRGDAKALALALDANASPVINHTPDNFLPSKPVLITSRPFLITCRQGVELSVVSGNLAQVEAAMPPDLAKPNGGNSWILRGSAHEQVALVDRLAKSGIDVDKFRYTYAQDIPETDPTPIIASKPGMVNQTIRKSEIQVGPDALKLARDFRLKDFQMTDAQVMGVAFAVDQSHVLIGDETGAGKTVMAAAAAELKTPAGRKSLIICPPGLVQQWIRQIDRNVPLKEGPPPLESVPEWMARLPSKEREEIDPMWQRVGARFVFLPDSMLISGLEVSRGKIKLAQDEPSRLAISAKAVIERLIKEPVATTIIDEGQSMRAARGRLNMAHALVSNRVKGSFDVESVIICSATPLHREATDLFAFFKLLDIPKFRKMNIEAFCQDYCQRDIQLVDGRKGFKPPVAPYGYGMLKEEVLAECAEHLNDRMISRSKTELAPGRSRPLRIELPIAYEPSAKFGIALPDVVQAGEMVRPDIALTEKLAGNLPYQTKAIAIANSKVAATVAAVMKRLAEREPHEKVLVFSQFIATAQAIADTLNVVRKEPAFLLTSNSRINDKGEEAGSKQKLIDQFIDPAAHLPSRVLVMTAGAGGTGIDGLHLVSRDTIVNDYSVVPGTNKQALGRNNRIHRADLGPHPAPVTATFMLLDHPSERHNFNQMLERTHEQEFIRQQGRLQALDTPDQLASREILKDAFAEKIMGIVGRHHAPSITDNTYLEAKALISHDQSADEQMELQMQERAPDPNLALGEDLALDPVPPEQLRAAVRPNATPTRSVRV